MYLTEVKFRQMMPRAKSSAVLDIVDALNRGFERFEIKDREEQAMFLANLAHESNQYMWMREIWGPTSEQKTYERDFDQPWGPQLKRGDRNFKAWTLGNSEVGDGRKFAGHGPIQITGRTNHLLIGWILEVDLATNPEKLTEYGTGTLGACAWWWNFKIGQLVPKGIRTVRIRVNGGTNGLAEVSKYYEQYRQIL